MSEDKYEEFKKLLKASSPLGECGEYTLQMPHDSGVISENLMDKVVSQMCKDLDIFIKNLAPGGVISPIKIDYFPPKQSRNGDWIHMWKILYSVIVHD